MKIKEQLLSEGFNCYKDPIVTDKQCYEESYQLKIEDGKGIKLFINIDLYDYNKADWQHKLPSALLDDLQGVYEVQFHLEDGGVFNVDYVADTPKKAIEFFNKMFYSMGCCYYEECEF